MHTLEIKPGSALGPFVIGASLGDSLHLAADYQRVEVKFSEEVCCAGVVARLDFAR